MALLDGRGNEGPAFQTVIVLAVAAALQTIQKAKLCPLYPQNLCPPLLIQLIWNCAIGTVSILYQSYHGNVHLHPRPCHVSLGLATLTPPLNVPTHTAIPSQSQTDSALAKSVTSSIIPATTQPLISPFSHCPLVLTGKCSSTLQHHPPTAPVGTASVCESTSQPQLNHSTQYTLTNWKTHTGPKELGYNKQERCLIYGKVKINGKWLERPKAGSANQPWQHFTSATPLRITVQTQSILDMPMECTRPTAAPSL